MNSFNHYAYGSICEWIYCDVCGLNPVEEFPGFKKVILKPHPDQRIGYARATYDSPMGRFERGWKIEREKVTYSFSIPFNVEAKLILLNVKQSDVEMTSFETTEEGDDLVAELTHGNYEIIYKYIEDKYYMLSRFMLKKKLPLNRPFIHLKCFSIYLF